MDWINEKRDPKAIVGVMISPTEWAGRLLLHEGDKLGDTIASEYQRAFKTPGELARFLTSRHWYVLSGRRFDVDPVKAADYEGGKIPSGVPASMGDVVQVVTGGAVQVFTQDHDVWFADYLYLVLVAEGEVAVYERGDEGWKLTHSIPLVAVGASAEGSESPDKPLPAF